MEKIRSKPSRESRSPSSKIESSAVAQRAYQLWEERGKPEGSSEDDWHRAEKELRTQTDQRADDIAKAKSK